MIRLRPLLALLACLLACDPNKGDTTVPGPSDSCTWRYELTGDSQENAHLFRDGVEVDAIAIEADPAVCTSGVRVAVTHRDAAAQIVVPQRSSCVTQTSPGSRPDVWFDHRVACPCAAPWTWFASNKAPPVKIKVEIRPVAACGGP